VTQRFDQRLEVHLFRQAANVMMALDHRRLAAQAALHNVGVDGALSQEIHSANLFGLFLKDADELLTNNFTLALRSGLSGQFLIEALPCIYADKVDVK